MTNNFAESSVLSAEVVAATTIKAVRKIVRKPAERFATSRVSSPLQKSRMSESPFDAVVKSSEVVKRFANEYTMQKFPLPKTGSHANRTLEMDHIKIKLLRSAIVRGDDESSLLEIIKATPEFENSAIHSDHPYIKRLSSFLLSVDNISGNVSIIYDSESFTCRFGGHREFEKLLEAVSISQTMLFKDVCKPVVNYLCGESYDELRLPRDAKIIVAEQLGRSAGLKVAALTQFLDSPDIYDRMSDGMLSSVFLSKAFHSALFENVEISVPSGASQITIMTYKAIISEVRQIADCINSFLSSVSVNKERFETLPAIDKKFSRPAIRPIRLFAENVLREAVDFVFPKWVAIACDGAYLVPKGVLNAEIVSEKNIGFFNKTGFDIKLSVSELDETSEEFLSALVEDNTDLASQASSLSDEIEHADRVEILCGKGFIARDDSSLFVWDGINRSIKDAVVAWLKWMESRNLIAAHFTPKGDCHLFSRMEGSNLWVESDKYLESVCTVWGDRIVREKVDKHGKKTGVAIPAGDSRSINEIIALVYKVAPTTMNRNSKSFIERTNTENIGKVFYTNGYYDLAAQRFVTVAEDPLASTLTRKEEPWYGNDAWNSVTEEEEVEFRKNFLGMLGKDSESQDCALSCYALAIGGAPAKMWFISVTKRNSGRSSLQQFMRTTFGSSYITSFSTPVPTDSSDPGAANREIITANLYIARIAFSNEVTEGKKKNAIGGDSCSLNSRAVLDGNRLKAWASGTDVVKARGMHQNESDYKVSAKLFISMNDSNGAPRFDVPDALDTCRFIAYPFKFAPKDEIAKLKLPSLTPCDPKIDDKFNANPRNQMILTKLIFRLYEHNAMEPSRKPTAYTTLMYQTTFGDQLSGASNLTKAYGEKFDIGEKTEYVLVGDLNKAFKLAETQGVNNTANRGDKDRYSKFMLEQHGIFEKIKKKVNGKAEWVWTGIKLKPGALDSMLEGSDNEDEETDD